MTEITNELEKACALDNNSAVKTNSQFPLTFGRINTTAADVAMRLRELNNDIKSGNLPSKPTDFILDWAANELDEIVTMTGRL